MAAIGVTATAHWQIKDRISSCMICMSERWRFRRDGAHAKAQRRNNGRIFQTLPSLHLCASAWGLLFAFNG